MYINSNFLSHVLDKRLDIITLYETHNLSSWSWYVNIHVRCYYVAIFSWGWGGDSAYKFSYQIESPWQTKVRIPPKTNLVNQELIGMCVGLHTGIEMKTSALPKPIPAWVTDHKSSKPWEHNSQAAGSSRGYKVSPSGSTLGLSPS